MKSDLEEVIEAYEAEKAELEREIAAYAAEGDYYYAHHHSRALKRVNARLVILNELIDPHYSDILQEQRKIQMYKQWGVDRKIDHESYFSNQVPLSEKKIEEWQGAALNPTYDSQEIDDAIFNLVKGNIHAFKLYFKTDPDVYLNFMAVGHHVEITLPYDLEHEYLHIFEDINLFKSLGFSFENGNLVYRYNLERFKDALEIKIMLARLIYEVFFFNRNYDSAKIVYE